MGEWKPLDLDTIIRAQCIFVSVTNGLSEIKDAEYLGENHGEHWIESYGQECVNAMTDGARTYEFVMESPGVTRPRLTVYRDNVTSDFAQLSGAQWTVDVSHLNHVSGPYREKVERDYVKVAQTMRAEGIPGYARYENE